MEVVKQHSLQFAFIGALIISMGLINIGSSNKAAAYTYLDDSGVQSQVNSLCARSPGQAVAYANPPNNGVNTDNITTDVSGAGSITMSYSGLACPTTSYDWYTTNFTIGADRSPALSTPTGSCPANSAVLTANNTQELHVSV